MATQKKGFSAKQHARHARDLRRARKALVDAYAEAMRHYPLKDRTFKALCRAGKALDRALFLLEEQSHDDDHPTEYLDPRQGHCWN